MGQNWAAEYLEAESKAATHGPDWTQEFLETKNVLGPPPTQVLANQHHDAPKWAAEYLEQTDHKTW